MKKAPVVALCLAGATALVAGPALSQSKPPTSERGVVVRSVSKWNGGCSGNNISSWDNMIRKWYDEMCDAGAHPGEDFWKDGFYHNSGVVDSDFTDPAIVSWGNDDASDRLDEADVLGLTMHGGNASSSNGLAWLGTVWSDEPGSGNCTTFQGSQSYGEDDVEFVFLSSCYSMDKENWWDEWETSFGGVHQIHGYHGIMWISPTFYGRHKDYADDSFFIATADAFVDNMFINNVFLNGHDQCPVPQGVGNNTSDLWDRMDREEYDWMFADPTGLKNGVLFISGCDPKGKGAL